MMAERAQKLAIARASSSNDPTLGPLRRKVDGARDGPRRKGGQGRGAVLHRVVADEPVREPIPVQGFGRCFAEKWMIQEPGQEFLVGDAPRGATAVLVEHA